MQQFNELRPQRKLFCAFTCECSAALALGLPVGVWSRVSTAICGAGSSVMIPAARKWKVLSRNFNCCLRRRERRASPPSTGSQLAPSPILSAEQSIEFAKRTLKSVGRAKVILKLHVGEYVGEWSCFFRVLCSDSAHGKATGGNHAVFHTEINPWRVSSPSLMSSILVSLLLHSRKP